MKQKICWQDFMNSRLLSRFLHMPQTQRLRWGFMSGEKSFKVSFLGNKSGCVISFKFSKADCVQILVFALVLPRGIFLTPVFVSQLSFFEVISLYCKFDS